MPRSAFKVVGTSLSGRGLAFDVSALVTKSADAETRGEQLAEIAESSYRQGRDSALLSLDDRFDLYGAVETLRALAVVMGPHLTGERHRRAADILARLLQDQEDVE